MKPRDILADDVQLRGPPFRVPLIGEPSRRQVIGQRVEPDPRSLLLAVARAKRKGNGPAEPRARDRDVLQPLLEERQNLIAPRLRTEEFRAIGVQSFQKTLVFRQAKKPIALFGPLQLASRVKNATTVLDLIVTLEQLAPDAVPAFVSLLVEVVRVLLR